MGTHRCLPLPTAPRALTLSSLERSWNAPPMVEVRDETDPLKIAMLELKEG